MGTFTQSSKNSTMLLLRNSLKMPFYLDIFLIRNNPQSKLWSSRVEIYKIRISFVLPFVELIRLNRSSQKNLTYFLILILSRVICTYPEYIIGFTYWSELYISTSTSSTFLRHIIFFKWSFRFFLAEVSISIQSYYSWNFGLPYSKIFGLNINASVIIFPFGYKNRVYNAIFYS